MPITRRNFLQSASITFANMILPAWMPRLSFAPQQTAPRGDLLVCIFLRGAADALNIVAPCGENEYYNLRPTLAIPRPDDARAQRDLRARDLDGFFGLHPSLNALLPAWQDKQLGFVHACGAPDESRSHFQAMALMERGVENEVGPASGWIGRHLASLDNGNRSPLRAIGFGERVPRSLLGAIPATALRSIADFHLGGDARAVAQMQALLAALYTDADPLSNVSRETLEVLRTLERLDPARYNARYPQSDLGLGLRQVALLVKAEVGLEVACLDVGGWDTHIAQGGSAGLMAKLLRDLGDGLAAFYADMREQIRQIAVITLSEFGRRAHENGGLGTDHGHGGVMMLMGGGVVGGRVHGAWPGLADGQLIGPGDLAVTTDYRDVLGEIVQKRLRNDKLSEVFPNYTPKFRGVIR